MFLRNISLALLKLRVAEYVLTLHLLKLLLFLNRHCNDLLSWRSIGENLDCACGSHFAKKQTSWLTMCRVLKWDCYLNWVFLRDIYVFDSAVYVLNDLLMFVVDHFEVWRHFEIWRWTWLGSLSTWSFVHSALELMGGREISFTSRYGLKHTPPCLEGLNSPTLACNSGHCLLLDWYPLLTWVTIYQFMLAFIIIFLIHRRDAIESKGYYLITWKLKAS
jgi:hypothetical protein